MSISMTLINSNPFATLTTKGKFEATEFHSSELNLDNIKMDFKR